MNGNDVTPPIPTVPATEAGGMQYGEIKKASFWVSQIFILLATIVGVYLASSQGFKQAMAYGNLQAARNNYFLRKSLRMEMSDNLDLVREYMKRLETGGLPARKAPFALDTFVWESMKNSSATMEIPPVLLQEARKFYRGVADLHQKVVDNTYSVNVAREKLTTLVDHVENDVLPKYDANIEQIGRHLRNNAMDID